MTICFRKTRSITFDLYTAILKLPSHYGYQHLWEIVSGVGDFQFLKSKLSFMLRFDKSKDDVNLLTSGRHKFTSSSAENNTLKNAVTIWILIPRLASGAIRGFANDITVRTLISCPVRCCFGVSLVLRKLDRLCQFYGRCPLIIGLV